MFTNFVLLISRVICRGNSQLLEYSRLPDLDHPGLAPHWSVHYLSPSLTIYGPAHQLILSPTLPLLTGRILESHIAEKYDSGITLLWIGFVLGCHRCLPCHLLARGSPSRGSFTQTLKPMGVPPFRARDTTRSVPCHS